MGKVIKLCSHFDWTGCNSLLREACCKARMALWLNVWSQGRNWWTNSFLFRPWFGQSELTCLSHLSIEVFLTEWRGLKVISCTWKDWNFAQNKLDGRRIERLLHNASNQESGSLVTKETKYKRATAYSWEGDFGGRIYQNFEVKSRSGLIGRRPEWKRKRKWKAYL